MMVQVLYVCGGYLLITAAYGYSLANRQLGMAPIDGAAKAWFEMSGFVASTGLIVVLIWGFFVFAWWLPIGLLVVGGLTVGALSAVQTFYFLTLIATYVSPVGLVLCLIALTR